MNIVNDPKDAEGYMRARTSFSGQNLTEGQFADVMAITSVIDRDIHKRGKFKEKLGDYSYAFARTENLDPAKAEVIIRDLYKTRFGMSMNDRRKALMANEEKLTQDQKDSALPHARNVGQSIQFGVKVSFFRASDNEAIDFATKLNITESGAKTLMSEAFEKAEGTKFYEWGKDLEKQHYTPQIEAEKEQRKAEQAQSTTRTRSHSMG